MLRRKSRALQFSRFVASVSILLITGQIGFILYQGTSFCLNDGCRIVEELTKVPPLFFNLVGLLFFLVVYLGLQAARGERNRLSPFMPHLLLAALGVEAVLTSFQYLVAHTFCAYCLTILASIILLNCLLGFRQIMAGVMVAAAMSLAFASLDLHQSATGRPAFVTGIFASRPGVAKYPEHYLFYASTCAHCEKVIASLKTNVRVTVHFNPIDQVSGIDLDNVTVNASYVPSLNKALLDSLLINEIPVLMTRTSDGWDIRRGEAAVLAALGLPASTAAGGRQADYLATPGVQSAIPGMESSNGCQVSSQSCTSLPEPSTIR